MVHDSSGSRTGSVDLYWLPLGAGGHCVRINGRVFETVVARREHRRACDLYHSALEVRLPEGRFVVESSWPIPDTDGPSCSSADQRMVLRSTTANSIFFVLALTASSPR